MVRVPSHRDSSETASETAALGEGPCSFFLLEVSEGVLEQPTASRRTAHPIRKVPTTAMRCPRRTTTHPPSLTCVPCYQHLEACHTTKPGASLSSSLLTEVRGRRILGSSLIQTHRLQS